MYVLEHFLITASAKKNRCVSKKNCCVSKNPDPPHQQKIHENFFQKKSFALSKHFFKKKIRFYFFFHAARAKNEIVSEKYFGKFLRKKNFFDHVNIYKRMETDKIVETITDLPKSTDDCTHQTLEELDGSIFCTECGVETDRVLQPSRNRIWDRRIRR